MKQQIIVVTGGIFTKAMHSKSMNQKHERMNRLTKPFRSANLKHHNKKDPEAVETMIKMKKRSVLDKWSFSLSFTSTSTSFEKKL